jgi:hypothetical protein
MEFRQGRFGLQRLGFLAKIHAGGEGTLRAGGPLNRPKVGRELVVAGTGRYVARDYDRPRQCNGCLIYRPSRRRNTAYRKHH